jgi:hypothetical protein
VKSEFREVYFRFIYRKTNNMCGNAGVGDAPQVTDDILWESGRTVAPEVSPVQWRLVGV